MTLVEVLITVGLFGIFLSLLGVTVVQGYKAYLKGSRDASLFRGASIAMERIRRALHTCERIYAPESAPPLTGAAGYIPRAGSATPVFVFAHTNPAGAKEVIAYQWRPQTNEIVRWLYSPSFPADQTVLPDSTKVLAPSAQDLVFRLEQTADGEFLSAAFTSYPDKGYFPLSTTVRITASGL